MADNIEQSLSGIEIVEIPREYIESHNTRADSKPQSDQITKLQQRYDQFLSSLLHARALFGIRCQVKGGNPRLFFLTDKNKKNIAVLESAFIAHFPKFRMERKTVQGTSTGFADISVALICGIPKPSIGSLNALTRIMAKVKCDSLYQAWAFPKKPAWARKAFVRRKLESALYKSQKQESMQSWLAGSSTRTKYNVPMTAKAKQYESEFQRLSSTLLLDCNVILVFYNGPDTKLALENALGILFGLISQSDRQLRLKSKIYYGDKAISVLDDALHLKHLGHSTLALPKEAIPYFEIPRIEMGIRQGYSGSFSTAVVASSLGVPDFRPGYITFGPLYSNRSLDVRRVMYMPLDYLRRHFAIIGMTGSGKSSAKNRIVIDAWKNGISSLLIEPVKTDARVLMGAIDEARLFTVGLEQAAPIRLNPLHVEEGVHVALHINLLVASFLAAWPVHGVLANYLRRVISRTYENKGWDTVNNIRGADVTLEDLWYEGNLFAKALQYGNELQMDFRGAILGRIEDLCDPARAAIFNATKSISVEELLSVPTIIELKHLGDQDFKAFFLSLLFVKLYEHFDKLGPSDRLRTLLFIDEAHAVLEEIPKAADSNDVASAKRKTVDQITDMIAESRSLGLGIGIMDQNALRLSRDALKICHTKILHTNTSEQDRKLLASETGCNKEQTQQIDVLRVGEVIMRGPDQTVPINVQIIHDPDTYPEMRRMWTNEDIRNRMTSFFENHPEFAYTPLPPALPGNNAVEESVSDAVQVEDVITSDGFRNQYLQAIKDEVSQEHHLVEEIIVYYASHIAAGDPSAFEIATLLVDRASNLYGSGPYELDWALIRQLVGEHAETFMDKNKQES